jgi:hypothetical protein
MEYRIEYEINGGEYTGYVMVECKSLKVLDARTVSADGVQIMVDEDIEEVYEGVDKLIYSRYAD